VGCSTHGLIAGRSFRNPTPKAKAVAPATSAPRAHPLQRRRMIFMTPRGRSVTPLPRPGTTARSIDSDLSRPRRTAVCSLAFPGCRFVGSAAADSPARMRARSVSAASCVMRLYVIGIARSGYVAHAQRMRLRLCQTASTEHRDTQCKAQRYHDRRSARDSLRARVVLPLAEPPLRHHHHKLYKVAAKPPSLLRLSSSPSSRE
jgi:hypothetical protein